MYILTYLHTYCNKSETHVQHHHIQCLEGKCEFLFGFFQVPITYLDFCKLARKSFNHTTFTFVGGSQEFSPNTIVQLHSFPLLCFALVTRTTKKKSPFEPRGLSASIYYELLSANHYRENSCVTALLALVCQICTYVHRHKASSEKSSGTKNLSGRN